jgi:hypothetical protein
MANFKWSDLGKYAQKQNMRLDQIVRRSLLDVSRNVILKTPVDTGRARNNWQTAINVIPDGISEGQDKSGAKAIGSANATIGGAVGQVYYLVNNLAYIRKLEYGHSDQAPSGMVRLSLKEFDQIARAAINSTR